MQYFYMKWKQIILVNDDNLKFLLYMLCDTPVPLSTFPCPTNPPQIIINWISVIYLHLKMDFSLYFFFFFYSIITSTPCRQKITFQNFPILSLNICAFAIYKSWDIEKKPSVRDTRLTLVKLNWIRNKNGLHSSQALRCHGT